MILAVKNLESRHHAFIVRDGEPVKFIKETKCANNEKRIHLVKELDKLMLDSDGEDNSKAEPKKKTSTLFKPLRACSLGSVSGPIVWL